MGTAREMAYVAGGFTLGALLAGVAVSGVARTHAAPPSVIRAQRFELVDQNGKLHASLGKWPGSPQLNDWGLFLYNNAGKMCAVFSADPDPGGARNIALLDDQEGTLATITAYPQRSTMLHLYTRDRKARIVLVTSSGKNPYLRVYDKAGKAVFSAP